MKFLYTLAVLAVVLLTQGRADTAAERKAAILKDRASLENDPRWIYNDSERGFSEARRTGKPLLVVIRCVPCLACAGLDARVLLENTELSPLLDKFVCVRVINANALDLSRFRFDFDLSFTTMIFNGDGTLYGRYGSWTHQKDPREEATDGFRKALERALEIHKGYPADKAMLAGKQATTMAYKTPIDIPALHGKYSRSLDWDGKLLASCVHCHQIGDALREVYRDRKERIPSKLVYPFPAPETIGLELALDEVARVKAVAAGSAADKAGVKAGDDLVSLGGQALISSADVSWVLHQTPDTGSLEAVGRRDGRESKLTIELPEGWRFHADISRRAGTWEMRAMALGGMLLEDLSEEERGGLGLKKEDLGLRAKYMGDYGQHGAAKKAGFRKNDVIVAIGGSSLRETEGELIGRLLRDYEPGAQVKATVLRGGDRVQLELPMQ